MSRSPLSAGPPVLSFLAAVALAACQVNSPRDVPLGDGEPARVDAADGGDDRPDGPAGGDRPDGPAADGPVEDVDAGPSCGYKNQGTSLQVAKGIEICLPPVVCTAETCPPGAGKCVFSSGYSGLLTLREAWATHYCDLSTAGCHGITQINHPEVTAQMVSNKLGHPLCDTSTSGTGKCIGIVASSPMVVGNSQQAVDPATGEVVYPWGLGLTEASGLCYEIAGPGGTAIVALTDRCGGYCRCNGSGAQECGPCVNSPSMKPNCACVGTVPPLYDECCGRDCQTTQPDCDWCASNNHPHFDLDVGTFNWVCGQESVRGSCRLPAARYIPCLPPNPAWPPGGGGPCKTGSFSCTAPVPHQEKVPGRNCCCNWNQCPQDNGSCAAPAAPCKAGSCACGPGMPDANHPKVPSTGCCCIFGTTPKSDGTCQ